MTEADRAKIVGHPVLLYDGVCALCNGIVRFVLKRDTAGVFRFAVLESEAARELLGKNASTSEGVALVAGAFTTEQRVYRRSDAVAEVLRLLGRRGLGRALALMPRWLREAGYGAVARVRYRVFGRYQVCPLPAVEERGRFVGFESARE